MIVFSINISLWSEGLILSNVWDSLTNDQWPVVSDECCWHVCLQCDVSAVRGERTLVTQVSVTMVASVSLCSVSTGSTGAALWSPQSTSLSPSSWMKWHGSPHPRGAGSSSVRVIRREAGTRNPLLGILKASENRWKIWGWLWNLASEFYDYGVVL